MDFKFLHASDIHLDSPLRGLDDYEGAPSQQIQGVTRRALENMVQLAIREQVQFVLLSGDIYDGDWKDYNTGLFFSDMLTLLHDAKIRVFLISGNHDAASQITLSLRLPPNTCVFPMHQPETVLLTDLNVAVHGQGFAQRAVKDNMALHYPELEPNFFNIGMLHTSATGRVGHEPYAPCSLDDMVSKGYHYWALGHVHKREILLKDPWIVFPGNLQGRDIRETGPKGCTIVNVKDKKVTSVQHHDVSVFRWESVNLDIAGASTGEEVVEMVMHKFKTFPGVKTSLPHGIRLTLVGISSAHDTLIREADHWESIIRKQAAALSIWIEKLQFHTSSDLDFSELLRRQDPLGSLIRTLDQLGANGTISSDFNQVLDDLKAELPAELLELESDFQFDDPTKIKDLYHEVKQFLIPQLMSKGKNL